MATFNDINSGFDLEFVLDDNFFRHLFQIFYDAEPALIVNNLALLKNGRSIERSYDVDLPSGEIINLRLFDFDDSEEEVQYLAINPLNFNSFKTLFEVNSESRLREVLELEDEDELELVNPLDYSEVFVLIKLAKDISFKEIVENIKGLNEGSALFPTYKNSFHIAGVYYSTNNSFSSGGLVEDSFLEEIREHTKSFFTHLIANEDFGIPNELKLILSLLNSADNFELFLGALSNNLIKRDGIDSLLTKLGWFSPVLFQNLLIRQPEGESRLKIFANFNRISSNLSANANRAINFAPTDYNGLGINLSENLIQELFLSIVKAQMDNLLSNGTINQDRFDEIQYEFPFAIPRELFELMESDWETDIPDAINLLEINKIKLDVVRHKFDDHDSKLDALKVEVVLSNNASSIFEDILDFITPNPHLKMFFAFYEENNVSKVFTDLNVGIPFNVFTGMILGPITATIGVPSSLITGLGFSLISSGVISSSLSETDTSINSNKGLPILTKRWDPFYNTKHKLKFNITDALINEVNGQIKILSDCSLILGFEPYPTFLKEVSFQENELQNVTYSFNNFQDLLRMDLPATSRALDFYSDINTVTDEIMIDFNEENKGLLDTRKILNRIETDIPYRPMFAQKSGSTITLIRIISDLQRAKIKSQLVYERQEARIQQLLDLFFELILDVVPDFDTNSVDASKLSDITNRIRSMVRETTSFENYKNEGWEIDYLNYLEDNPEQMLELNPTQIALLGLNSPSVEQTLEMVHIRPDELFDFIDMNGYQAVAVAGDIFIRNTPNETRNDNISTLPDFE